jgi:2-succinyl-5-enolpyruvyl-6-hydroxy-3-cyclohexene-1-carboxylate synthase
MKVLTTDIALHVIKELIARGVHEFCLCPGARNSLFVTLLEANEALKTYTFYEERSAAFFALGLARQTKKGVAVITTSGTAAGELLPAVMEAHYLGVPLVLVTADRPRRYRGTGAPQTAEQVDLYKSYVSYSQDVAGEETCDLSNWLGKSPLHLNVCLEDPRSKASVITFEEPEVNTLDEFLSSVSCPLVVVSALDTEDRESVIIFLIKLNCPVILEGISGLRDEPRLSALQIKQTDYLLNTSKCHGYLIDGVLRIGGIPTLSLWRNLEVMHSEIKVFSISPLPFKGLNFGSLIQCDISKFFKSYRLPIRFESPKNWLEADIKWYSRLVTLYEEIPTASPSIMHRLSKLIPANAHVYLGNSLPIREWDLAATYENKNFQVKASRGLNGIDGQMSTFFGLSTKDRPNFAILGDLTTLYDMAAPWILPQIPEITATVIVINNGGGKIFTRMFTSEIFQNNHDLNFKPLADMWGMEYEKWEFGLSGFDACKDTKKNRLIEIIPDNKATGQFWDRLDLTR